MFYKSRSYTTAEYKEWQVNILELLGSSRNQESLKYLRDTFDSKEHRVEVLITHYFPQHIMFTEEGLMSSKAFDITNIEKPLVDIIFLPKYYKQNPPYGIKNFNNDDKFISDCVSRKRASYDFVIEVNIAIKPLSDIWYDPTSD